jgi:Protein of unknown function (DUF3300)/Chaperone of endosialidase
MISGRPCAPRLFVKVQTVMTTCRSKVIFISLVAFFAMLIVVSPVRAQEPSPATTPLPAAEIEQLVAPVALYPDDLLSQVLMASTYPLEIVEAARWVSQNPNVTGKALEDAMQKQTWDPSVKALTAVPQTLQMMSDQIKWTQDLGNAFLAQQTDVLDAVQRLRARADKAGNLNSTPQQTVRRVNRPGGVSAAGGAPAMAYEIAPAIPDEYFVPIYDPTIVYGVWPYDDYLPFYWYPPGWGGGWYGFGAGFFAGAAIWGGINWWNRNVHVDHHRYNQFNRTNISNGNWSHNVDHRRGVGYNNSQLTNRFGDQGRGKARDQARQKLSQGGMGKGGMGGMGQGGMGGGMAGGMGGGMGKGGMGSGMAGGMGGGMASKSARRSTSGMGGMASGMGGMASGMGGMSTRRASSGMAGMAGGGMAGGGMYGGGGMGFSSGGSRGLSGGSGFSGGGTRSFGGGGGGFSSGGGGRGGGFSGGGGRGGGGGGGRGGGRRSDIELKENVTLLGHLANGIGFYRFVYKGTDTVYVGVMAQEVQRVRPDAVTRGSDGYLRVFYDKLGLKFQTYDQWLAAGARVH